MTVAAEVDGTRRRILRLVVESGPVAVVELARDLHLTAAGVRRHIAAMEEAGEVAVHRGPAAEPAGRGRPARRYVATDRGQAELASTYADLASQALAWLAQVAGEGAIEAFAEHRVRELEDQLHQLASQDDVEARLGQLAEALAHEGYATSVRPVPGGRAVQLCQGHCPVQDVAATFPALCEAETRMFSRVLGVHVQRLSTLAAGGHVCTTHVPVGVLRTADAETAEPAAPVHTPGRIPAAEGDR
jgi:predicted ArsR family transcriptional regulator